MLNRRLISCSLLILRTAIFVKCRLHSMAIVRFSHDFASASEQSLIRHKREVPSTTDSTYSWTPTKTPTFVTTQMKKHLTEPILTIFPSEGTFRSGKSREIPVPEYNGAKRIVYYSLLPDVSHYSSQPPFNPYSEYVTLPAAPLRSNQRSYSPNNAGKDFVTRVHSTVINVSGEDKNGNQKSNLPFTIIDAPLSQYPINSVNKGVQPAAYPNKHMTGIEYHQPTYAGYHQKPYISDFKLPYSSSLPYYNAGNGIGLSQYQYHQHSSPYYDEVEKIHTTGHDHQQQFQQHYQMQQLTGTAPYQSPPFPTRHLRFPANRYPLSSPFSDLLSSSKPYTPPIASQTLDSSFPEHSSNSGFGDSLTANPYGLEFNNNLGPVTMDNNLDLNNNKFTNKQPNLRNKFSNFNKYSDASEGFDSPFFNSPIQPTSDSFLENKPFDAEAFNWAAAAMQNAVTGEKGFHVKGSSSPSDTANQNSSAANAAAELEKTTLAPSTNSPSDANTDETQTEIALELKKA